MSAELAAADSSTPQGAIVPAIVQASSATSAPVAIPAEWYGQYVRFTFIGAAATDVMCIRFGTTAALAAVTTLATASTNAGAATYAITPAGTEPMLVLPSGMPIDERLDASWRFFCHIAPASGALSVALKQGRYGESGH